LALLLASFLFGAEKRSKYFIAIKKNDGTPLSEFIPLLPPKDKFYADPFLFKHEGVNYVFFEDYDYKKGVVSYAVIGENGAISKPKLALELPIHLSFPYVFKEDDTIYMIPETYRYRSISLYRSILFPNQWEHQRVLVQGEYFSDPILFKHNGYYWLFAAVQRDRLRIYFAKSLDSKFFPHPINSHNIRGRNAGPLFFSNGKWIRPTMDCSIRYGRSIILKEMVVLTPQVFLEREIAYIEPDWAPSLDGTHSYCQNEDFVVYDGERLISHEEDALYSD
jgi:hypothetical protein